jgi:O-antigen ligase
MIVLITALLAWGVLSFGAVYPWAYAVIAFGIAGVALPNVHALQIRRPGLVAVSLGFVVLACGLQLVSLPLQTLEQLSPATSQYLRRVNVAFASGLIDRHAASIDPGRTLRALGFIVFGATWAWACSTLAQRNGEFPRALARNLVGLGLVVAVIGLAQRATFNGKLLWFWEPMFYSTNAFGPFVNRNHFAGWMLLALTIGIGYLFGTLTQVASNTSTWRDRLLWAGSPQGTTVLMTAVAIVVMGCSLVWTMSRSGIAAAGAGASILFAAAVYRSKHRILRVALAGYLALAVVGIVAWRGTDTLFAWYGNTTTLEWRFVLWRDTIPALKDFWMTGSGLNTYGTLMVGYPHTHTDFQPREAHSDYLQLAVEGGLLLCVPVFLLILAVGRRTVQRLLEPQGEMTWWIRMGAAAGMCGIAVQELTEFSLQIPGVALLFATCLALALHEPAPIQSRRRSHRKTESAAVPAA